MNRFLVSERSRAGLLAVAASLVGGTGCVTATVIGSVQQQQQVREYQQRVQRENAVIRAAAQQGDSAAMTRLGWYEVVGNRFGVAPDAKAGAALLERAAARPFAPAQYLLGTLLVEGDRIAPDPARGMDLLKRAAGGACVVGFTKEEIFGFPAWKVGTLYRRGYASRVARDDGQADLWMARSVIHCHAAYSTVTPPGLAPGQLAARELAWGLLAGRTRIPGVAAITPERRAALPPAQLEAAEHEAQQLLRRVRESENEYPAPPEP